VIADVVRGHAVDDCLDLLAIRVIVEIGRRRAGDGDQAVLGVVVEREVLSIRAIKVVANFHSEKVWIFFS
jgi:hypothetical protein